MYVCGRIHKRLIGDYEQGKQIVFRRHKKKSALQIEKLEFTLGFLITFYTFLLLLLKKIAISQQFKRKIKRIITKNSEDDEEGEEKTDLGDEVALGRQELDGKLDGINNESGL